MSKVTLRLSTTESVIFSLPGSPSLLPDLSRPKDWGAPEALSKATLAGSWRGASPDFITMSKVGAEGCQAKPQKTPAKEKQGPACQSFRAGDGEHSWQRGQGGRTGQPLKALCERMLRLQPTLAIVPTKSAEEAKLFSPAGQWGAAWGPCLWGRLHESPS